MMPALVLLLVACHPGAEKRVVVVTSTALAGTGLPQLLVDRFVAESRTAVRLLVLDEDSIPRAVTRAKADLVILNSPTVNQLRTVTEVRLENTFAYDDFMIVGPRSDRAHAGDAKSAREAFRKIADSGRWFCSPSQVPAFRGREAEIWRAAGIDPHTVNRWVQCKGDAEAVLAESARRGAYTLTDRATFERSRVSGKLELLMQNAPLLHNDVTVALLSVPGRNANADWFIQWLMSYRGRELVDGYRFDDGRRFFSSDAR